jgi:hypothetical protein
MKAGLNFTLVTDGGDLDLLGEAAESAGSIKPLATRSSEICTAIALIAARSFRP